MGRDWIDGVARTGFLFSFRDFFHCVTDILLGAVIQFRGLAFVAASTLAVGGFQWGGALLQLRVSRPLLCIPSSHLMWFLFMHSV